MSGPHHSMQTIVPGTPVTSPSKLADIKRVVQQAWNVPYSSVGHPCMLPVSLEKKHLPRLTDSKCMVTEKSDGIRCHAVFLQYSASSECVCVLTDRRHRAWEIPSVGQEDYYALGTVLDGELVWCRAHDDHENHDAQPQPQQQQPARQLFLVFDAVMVKGESFVKSRKTLSERFQAASTIVDTNFQDIMSVHDPREWFRVSELLASHGKLVSVGNEHGLAFRTKPHCHTSFLDTLSRRMSSLPYCTDGLIFTMDEPLRVGTNASHFKWKPLHTIDLEVVVVPHDVLAFAVYVTDASGERAEPVVPGCLQRLRVLEHDPMRMALQSLADATRKRIRVVVECSIVDPRGDSLTNDVVCTMMHVRSDKDSANNAVFIQRTLHTIAENITMQDLLQHCCRHQYHHPLHQQQEE